MCGIAGRFNFKSGAPVDPQVIRGMCTLLAHRGPDGEDVFQQGAVGLGHRRLAIIDLSDAGRQPMGTPDGRYWITFNGEIYNYLELRQRFERSGYRFHSRTDTEVILAAYSVLGPDCLTELRGMFALAIWDAHHRTLFLARDRFGKKPLYFRVDGEGIAFASEPKAFLAEPGFTPRPDLEGIAQYLSYHYVPSPYSAFSGVSRIRPAHYALVDAGGMTTTRYWRLRYQPKSAQTEREATEQLVAELREATRLRLISDVPLGAFLSGGVDSSAIVALMAQETNAPVKTFSIGFAEKDFDELTYARAVAQQYGTDHREFIVRPDATEIFADLVWHYNEPYADSSAIPTYYLAKLTREHVTVALNGDGGDEAFGGYSRYLVPRGVQMYSRLPLEARAALAGIAGHVPRAAPRGSLQARASRWFRRNSLPPARWAAANRLYFDRDLRETVWSRDFQRTVAHVEPTDVFMDESCQAESDDLLDAMLAADVNWYLPDGLLVKVDIATMAHGLEARSPFIDHKVMEFAATLPSSMKVRHRTTKYILKEAFRTRLPADIIDRPKKGFSVPLRHWFRHELKEFAYDTLLDGRARQRGYFNMPQIERLLDEHASGTRDWQENIWILLMLELWHRTFIDRPPTKPIERSHGMVAAGRQHPVPSPLIR
jgi:asparagine synthase (glutamine-hydrolysing)